MGTTRLKTAYVGDVGEAQVLQLLLDTGASINDLTKSDYGLDLHVQLPESVLDSKMLLRLDRWQISSRFAHVQVKKKTVLGTPSASVGDFKNWTDSVVPTFVIFVRPEGITYLNPAHIESKYRNALNAGAVASSSLSLGGGLPLPKERHLSELLAIWTKHHKLMRAGANNGDSFDHVISIPEDGRKDFIRAEALELVSDISLAWLQEFDTSDVYSAEWSSDVRRFAGAAAGCIIGTGQEHEDECFAFEEDVIESVSTLRYANSWKTSRYAKIYTQSDDARVAYDHGITAIEEICDFMVQISDPWI
jgi:hypothetical protein